MPTDVRPCVTNQISGQGTSGRYDQHDYLAEKHRALEPWEQRLLGFVDVRPASGKRLVPGGSAFGGTLSIDTTAVDWRR